MYRLIKQDNVTIRLQKRTYREWVRQNRQLYDTKVAMYNWWYTNNEEGC